MTVNLPTTSEKCHCTTLSNTELVHLTEGIELHELESSSKTTHKHIALMTVECLCLKIPQFISLICG